MAFRIIRNRQDAEDVVQDVFVKMWSMGEKLDGYKDAGALAVTITRNNCIDMLRKMKYIDGNVSAYTVRDSGLSPSPHDQLEKNEISVSLTRIIDDLPSHYREIIKLREIDGLSYEEISQMTSININSLRVNLSRARRMIRDEYLKQTDERGKTERTS